MRGWSPLVALQADYSLLERTAERELLPVAEAFGLSVTAWAPMGAGILTGKYTRGSTTTPEDSRRAAASTPPRASSSADPAGCLRPAAGPPRQATRQ
jgi:aryl-alcohol dehydrogenase-like predicted oxidoreductase